MLKRKNFKDLLKALWKVYSNWKYYNILVGRGNKLILRKSKGVRND